MIEQCDIRRHGRFVVLSHAGRSAGMTWQSADGVYWAIRRAFDAARSYDEGRAEAQTTRETIGKMTVHLLGLMVVIELAGVKWIECPYQIANRIGKAIYGLARAIEADEEKVAWAQIHDMALTMQHRGPVILSADRRKLYEAQKEAAGVGGIKPPIAVFGIPAIIGGKP